MKHSYVPLLIAALTWFGTPAQAERADRDKPMNIEADALRYADQKQISTFSGRVVLTKGTLVMRGALLETRQDAQGNQFGVLTADPGKRAFFRQKREGVDEYIEGEAERIDYNGQADTVHFTRRAELRRYHGATLADEITGNVIMYDNKTEAFTVDGVVNATGRSRVRAMLTPRAAASTPSPAQAVPVLRPSLTLDGERK